MNESDTLPPEQIEVGPPADMVGDAGCAITLIANVDAVPLPHVFTPETLKVPVDAEGKLAVIEFVPLPETMVPPPVNVQL